MERRTSVANVILIVLFFSATVIFQRALHVLSEGPRFLVPPPEHMELFDFGFRESISDSLWLRWIQDNDICQTFASVTNPNPVGPNEGEFKNPRHRYCDDSWSFKMLDAITRITPRFEMPYLAGAITLSVLVEDYDGAKIIFDRGVENFPDDWHMLYRASYHYLFDRNDYPRAAELMVRAEQAGAPSWLTLLAAKLYSKSGQLEVGIATLENFKKSLTKESSIRDVEERITKLKKQLSETQ